MHNFPASVNTITPELSEISARNFQGIICCGRKGRQFENGYIWVRHRGHRAKMLGEPYPSILLLPFPPPLPFFPLSSPLFSSLNLGLDTEIQLRGLVGEHCKLPQQGLEHSPSGKRIWCILNCLKIWHLLPMAPILLIFLINNGHTGQLLVESNALCPTQPKFCVGHGLPDPPCSAPPPYGVCG